MKEFLAASLGGTRGGRFVLARPDGPLPAGLADGRGQIQSLRPRRRADAGRGDADGRAALGAEHAGDRV